MKSEEAAGPIAGARGSVPARSEVHAHWDELVIPDVSRELLRSIAGDVRFRRSEKEDEIGPGGRRRAGLRLMFAGEPGTGKRLATRMLAADLELPILSVELVSVLSRRRAESEERLGQLFETAERSRAIIYIADAGTWFGSRPAPEETGEAPTDTELASLLMRIDDYRGVIVFAATLGIASPAVVERLDHTVEFPVPDELARRRIWALSLPPSARVSDREIEFLATSFPLTGGAIRRCADAASSAAGGPEAPTDLRQCIAAIEHEYGSRHQGTRVRQALEAFYAGTWETSRALPVLEPPRPRRPPERRAPAPVPAPSRGAGAARSRPGLVRGLLLAGIVVAAVIGFVIARTPGSSVARPPALDAHVSAGSLHISVPAIWHRQPSPSGMVPALADEIVVGPRTAAGGSLVIGRTGTSSIALSHALIATLAHTPTAELVTLRGKQFERYLDAPLRAGGTASLYVLRTTAGTVLAQCRPQGPVASFASTCERAIGTVSVDSAHALPIAPNASYAAALDAAIAQLDSTAAAATERLRLARTARGQAAAALAAATAYRSAASAVAALHADAAQADNQAVATALRSTGDAYAALGRAAAGNDHAGYDTARGRVAGAGAALRAAIAALATLGYVVG